MYNGTYALGYKFCTSTHTHENQFHSHKCVHEYIHTFKNLSSNIINNMTKVLIVVAVCTQADIIDVFRTA